MTQSRLLLRWKTTVGAASLTDPASFNPNECSHHLSLCAVSSFLVIKRTHLKVYVCSMVPFAFSHLKLSVPSHLPFYPRDSSHPLTPPPFIPFISPPLTLFSCRLLLSQHLLWSQTSTLIDINSSRGCE